MAAVARRSTVGSFGALGGRVPTCSAVAREGRREDGYGAVASVRRDRRQDGVGRRSAEQRRPMERRRRSGLRGHGYEQFGIRGATLASEEDTKTTNEITDSVLNAKIAAL